MLEDGNSRGKAIVEAALFAAGRGLSLSELSSLTGISKEAARAIAEELSEDFRLRDSGLEIRSLEDRYVMQVRGTLAADVVAVAPREMEAPLIRTLGVIAYRQPIIQSDLVRIRGNKAYDHVRELERMGLIAAVRSGRSKEIRTTKAFADYFGLESDRPEFIRRTMGQGRRCIGVTAMFRSLAERIGLDFVVVNPYRPSAEDLEALGEIDLLVLSPGYAEKAKEHYSGEMVEAGCRTLSELKEGAELISGAIADCPDIEPLLGEIDAILLEYRARARGLPPIHPLTSIAEDLASDLHIPLDDDGTTVASSSSGQVADILVPVHQDYGMDIVERIKQRYEALLEGLSPSR
ncbi:MAG: SMC-Scp complex subunit ScpB [Methanotrichaceae archaeon]|nr:SMC-Scp complex subunit ScpB [Methanotrichaceae archaeon]